MCGLLIFFTLMQQFGIVPHTSAPTSTDRIYSETEIQLIMKVLHGAPITANGTWPWDITEPFSVKFDQESVKEDCKLTKTLLINSAIQHEQAGSGLFAGILQF